MAARFCLVARGRRGEEHCAETGEGGPGRDHGRVRPPRIHGIGHRKERHFVNGSYWARLKNVPGFREKEPLVSRGQLLCLQKPQ